VVKRVDKLLKEGFRVHSVYEAGPTGFALARRLKALGAECLVVRPRKLERYGRRRKTDPRDSRQLAEDLAHHVAGVNAREDLTHLCSSRIDPPHYERLRGLFGVGTQGSFG
jgi:transposase